MLPNGADRGKTWYCSEICGFLGGLFAFFPLSERQHKVLEILGGMDVRRGFVLGHAALRARR
jgi:hypothetical protein